MYNTMTHQKKPSSERGGDSFSFPSTPTPDSEFEFGFGVDSPSAGESFAVSPADHLFLNGRLLPHSFPLPATSRSTSTRDSLLSSRSNSTNSSCSSARTSSSDSSERKLFHNKVKGATLRSTPNSSSHYQPYGCSQRWQYITPVPGLNCNSSIRRRDTKQVKKKDKGIKRKNNDHKNDNNKKKKNKSKKEHKRMRLRFGRRILRWFVMACRECHAMEPSSSKDSGKEI
ncbi:hypothetical protein VNO78_37385 [Psophocarpus tetragonolobus]|uniref:Uncharacterized protein n=1 Tax=Psophocarpus tetragonolobus TaxID=3891 RepID=A0AAN9NHD3_PSOTE